MAGQPHASEATIPDKQALSSLFKYLKKQNLKVSGPCIHVIALASEFSVIFMSLGCVLY